MVWASKAYPENGEGLQWFTEGPRCGAKRSRTADLLNAIQALYQLSYSPEVRVFLEAGPREGAEPIQTGSRDQAHMTGFFGLSRRRMTIGRRAMVRAGSERAW